MSEKPNIVLVHGAWADGSSWSAVIEPLQARGYTVTAPQFPETSLVGSEDGVEPDVDVVGVVGEGEGVVGAGEGHQADDLVSFIVPCSVRNVLIVRSVSDPGLGGR